MQVAEKEEFRGYLEKSGTIDALTSALVSLYESTDKPEDVLGFITSQLSDSSKASAEIAGLKKENEDLKEEVKQLKARVGELETKAQESTESTTKEEDKDVAE